jgi:opacity protein-like surface antigen
MKRLLTAIASAAILVSMTAATALAQEGYGAGDVGSDVAGTGGSTAFTGSDVTTGVFVAIALVAIGVTALLVARRSAAKTVA